MINLVIGLAEPGAEPMINNLSSSTICAMRLLFRGPIQFSMSHYIRKHVLLNAQAEMNECEIFLIAQRFTHLNPAFPVYLTSNTILLC